MTKLLILRAKPKLYLKRPDNKFREVFYEISRSDWLENLINVLIVVNTVFLLMTWAG